MKSVSLIFLIGFLIGFGIGAVLAPLFDLQGPAFLWWFCCSVSGAMMGSIFTGIYNAAKEPAK